MTTIRQSVSEQVRAEIPQLKEVAIKWMQERYPGVDFENCDYIFSAGYSRSRYFPNSLPNAKYLRPSVCISTRARLVLYTKKRLGVEKSKALFVGSSIQIITSLIHELTHHVQYQTNTRKGNETDTTANELAYLREFSPRHYNKLVVKPFRVKI